MENIKSERLYKKIFIIISSILLILIPFLGTLSGQNADEDVESVYGRDIYKYYSIGDKQALDYTQHELGGHINFIEYYGGLVNLLAECSHQWFGVDLINSRHIIIGIIGALMMIFTGLLAYQLSNKKWLWGLVAIIFITFSPRLFGESLHNGKDIPFSCGIVMSIYFFYIITEYISTNIINKRLYINYLGLFVGFMITIGSRPAGAVLLVGFIGVITLIRFLSDNKFKDNLLKSNNSKWYIIITLISIILGYCAALIFWPKGQEAPIGNLIYAITEMANRSSNIRVLFEGKYHSSLELPWYYNFKWIFISSPIVVLISFIINLILIKRNIKKLGLLNYFIPLFCALFPLLYMIYKESTLLDTWRHSFFVYPFWAICGTFGIMSINKIKNSKLHLAIPILLISPEIYWTVSTTPYQYIYFNALVGGIKGANGQYDLDYYQTSGRELAKWVLNDSKNARKRVNVKTNMDAIYNESIVLKDTINYDFKYLRYNERFTKQWDYYISYGRFVSAYQLQNNWPPKCAAYVKTLKGVPISFIIKGNSDNGEKAINYINNKQFDLAEPLLKNSIELNNYCDENELFYYAYTLANLNRIEEACQIIDYAVNLDHHRNDILDLAIKLHEFKGDKLKVNKFKNLLLNNDF